MNSVIRVKNFTDDELRGIFSRIDSDCYVVEGDGGIQVQFPNKYIEFSSLIDPQDDAAKSNLEKHIEENTRFFNEQNSVGKKAIRKMGGWNALTSENSNKNKIIEKILKDAKSNGAKKLFSIRLSSNGYEILNRLPRLFYFLSRDLEGINSSEKRRDQREKTFEEIKQEQKGEYLLISTLDLLRYTHLYFFESFFNLGFKLSNNISVIYFLGVKTAKDRKVIPYDLPNTNYFLNKEIDPVYKSFLSFSTQDQYQYMAACVRSIDNVFNYIFNFHNFKDKNNFFDPEKVLKTHVSFKLYIDGIYANKDVNSKFSKVANSFRLLDQFSNLLYGLVDTDYVRKKEREKERMIFEEFFKKEFIIGELKKLFGDSSPYLNFIEKVLDEIINSGDLETFKEFRNTYTHGTFPTKTNKSSEEEDRFFRIFNRSKNVSSHICLLPQILLLAFGSDPEAFIKKIKESLTIINNKVKNKSKSKNTL